MRFTYKIQAMALLCALSFGMNASAEERLLASTVLEQDGRSFSAELWGDCLPSGYARNLLLFLKDEEQKLVTAYTPTVKGGYSCFLQPVTVRNAGEAGVRKQQLLLSVGQGDWQAGTEFRILDFSKPESVNELFSASDSMGVITAAHINEEKLEVCLQGGGHRQVGLAAETLPDIAGKPDYGGLSSLTAYDIDGDGKQELLVSQKIAVRGRMLAEAGSVWSLRTDDAEGPSSIDAMDGEVDDTDMAEEVVTPIWEKTAYSILAAQPTSRADKTNDGCEFAGGVVLSRRIVLAERIGTYPVVSMDDLEVQERVNSLLEKEGAEYLDAFFKDGHELAFEVIRSDASLLSIRIIGGRNGQHSHYLHIDPRSGERIVLGQLLDIDAPDLLPLLRLLNNGRIMLEQRLPSEWYLDGESLVLVQNICGQEEAASYDLASLRKFLLDDRFLPRELK